MNDEMKANAKISHYRIISKLGAGGMGEVYRARDERLDRDVAIKMLPSDVAGDSDRLQRFEQEAKATSALNHPNILAVYDIGEHDGAPFIVSELLEGEELRDRLGDGPLPMRKAVDYAEQIVSGLSAAHERGIVHRDLKPENIFITRDDRVKILDFGLAKLRESPAKPHGSEDATKKALTDPGVVLGTVGYMSPEQVRGLPSDHRSDIFSFGVVLYEMLTGQRAFSGDSVVETMHSILKEDVPDVDESGIRVPPALEKLMRRCLEKQPDHRFRSTHDLGYALEALSMSSSSASSRIDVVPMTLSPWRKHIWKIAFAVTALIAIALALWPIVFSGRSSTSAPLRRFAIQIPSAAAPNWTDFRVAVSPDGSQIAYNCREGNAVNICLRSFESLTAHRLTEAREAEEWIFSPDGEWIAVSDYVGLTKVSVRGGAPQMLVRWAGSDSSPDGLSWGPDGYILFGTPAGIRRVSAAGGSHEPLTHVASEGEVNGHFFPSHLPDGRSALITIGRPDGNATCGLVDLRDGSVNDLGIRGHGCVYVEPGRLVYKQGTTVMAAAFDLANPTRQLNPVPAIENVRSVPLIARDGTLVYVPTRGESTARLVWVDREGRASSAPVEKLDYSHLDLANDNRRALLNLDDGTIYLVDLVGGTRKLVANGSFPIWAAGGDRIVYRGKNGLHSDSADGSSASEVLVPQPGFIVPTSWNERTGDLAYYDHRAFEIWIRSTDGQTRRFLGSPGRKRTGRFSPDGNWLAFVSDETGENQVYVTAYPGPGQTVAVSTKGGLSPIWSSDGRELFFRLGTKLMAARMSSAQPLQFDVPVELFDGPYTLDLLGHQREDIASDGKRFLMVENSDDFPIVIVQNWALELNRLVR